jgi:uncharacterized surface protein with fasciclin (FAS1) repeats
LGLKEIVMFAAFARFTVAVALVAGIALLTLRAGAEPTAKKDIVDTAVAAGQFKTLAAALKAAGLVDTLKGAGPFTVFAPTDEAFAKLPSGTLEDLLKPQNKEKLVAILTYHVVPAKAMAADVAGMTSAKTVNGKELKLKAADGKVSVNDATVVKADVVCSNGVIHVIDAVLLP